MRQLPLVALGLAAAGHVAGPGLPAQPPVPAPPDSVVHDGVFFRGRLAVVPGRTGPELDVRVAVRSLRPDTVALEGESGTCNPPLYLRQLPGGRVVTWSDVAWQAAVARRRARGAPYGYGCTGTGLGVTLAPGVPAEWESRRYPVRAVRGDSLPPGWYAAAIGLVVGRDTLRVPAGRVRLP